MKWRKMGMDVSSGLIFLTKIKKRKKKKISYRIGEKYLEIVAWSNIKKVLFGAGPVA